MLLVSDLKRADLRASADFFRPLDDALPFRDHLRLIDENGLWIPELENPRFICPECRFFDELLLELLGLGLTARAGGFTVRWFPPSSEIVCSVGAKSWSRDFWKKRGK